MAELESLKTLATSPKSATNKQLASLQARLQHQDEIINKQLFLEGIDRKEREANLFVLGASDNGKSFDGAVTDDNKLKKVWAAMGAGDVDGMHRRLARRTEGVSARCC